MTATKYRRRTSRAKGAAKKERMPAFTTDHMAFADMVRRAARLVPDRVPLPVLRGVLITAHRDSVEVYVTDYENSGRAVVGADIVRPGRVLVEADVLARAVRWLPGPGVRIEVDGGYLTITSGPVRYRLLTMPVEEYPVNAPEGKPLDGRCKAPGELEKELVRGEQFRRRLTKGWRPPRPVKPPYSPTGFQVGAWITWQRPIDGGYLLVAGQVWSEARGSTAVWGLREGERSPVWVEQDTYVTRPHTQEARRRTRLIEVTGHAPPHLTNLMRLAEKAKKGRTPS